MALLVTDEHKPVFLSAEQANLLWLVKTGERRGTPATRAKVKRVVKWYLDRSIAPQSYLDTHPLPDEAPKPRPFVGQVRLPYID